MHGWRTGASGHRRARAQRARPPHHCAALLLLFVPLRDFIFPDSTWNKEGVTHRHSHAEQALGSSLCERTMSGLPTGFEKHTDVRPPQRRPCHPYPRSARVRVRALPHLLRHAAYRQQAGLGRCRRASHSHRPHDPPLFSNDAAHLHPLHTAVLGSALLCQRRHRPDELDATAGRGCSRAAGGSAYERAVGRRARTWMGGARRPDFR